MIAIETRGSFAKTEAFLRYVSKMDLTSTLNRYGQQGVNALASATPVDSGLTAASWYFETYRDGKYFGIIWKNRNLVGGRPVAILLQLGHGTGTGGYVQGRDYINPAIQPVFDAISAEVWREVTSK